MPRQIKGLKARLEFLPVGAAVRILRAMPIDRAVRFGARIGGLGFAVDRFNRPIAMRNLLIAFPALDESARLAILRDSYRNWGRMMAEWSHSYALTPGNIANFVTYENRQHWDDAAKVADGRGFVLTGHFGNFELLALAHSLYGYRVAIVYRPLRNPLINEAVRQVRERFGNLTIARRGAGQSIVRLFREGRWVVAMPLDLDARRGVFVDFFSTPAATSDGAARLAMLTGLPIVPAFLVREGSSARHRIHIMPRVEIVQDGDQEDAVRENTQRLVRPIESIIRRYPDHWNWIHRRWKTRPPGHPKIY
ncbi:MAG: lysophospholipid acyltransferase family protein [Candidatus Binataceae bacterium]|nr:lysophospholipid acyltransferase family protein [Candidatus Binataceae bacterium]